MRKRNELYGKIGVYQIRNVVNNMVYIGSSANIAVRWREHKYDLRMNKHRNKHLQNAYNKYGKDSFAYEVLEVISENEKEYQFDREQYWIRLKEACNKKKGYNIQDEVLIVPKLTKKVVCLETKEIFSSLKEAANIKKIDSGSISCCCHKKKLKQAGGYHWRFYDEYIDMTEEEIKEVTFDLKGRPFICLDSGYVYKNWKELPYKKGAISQCCSKLAKGEYSTCGGHKYMYLEDYRKLSEEGIEKVKGMKRKKIDSGSVVCLETGVIYENANRAAIELGLRSSIPILKCCYKKAITCCGFHWIFKEEYEKLSTAQIDNYRQRLSTVSFVKPVVCLESKKVYRSQIEAAKDTGMTNSAISKICKCGGYNTSKKSLHFVFLDEYNSMTESDIMTILSTTSKNMKKVRCVETGKVFNSVTEAAKSVKGASTNISKCCKNFKYICKGYHWEYVEKEK